MNLLTLLQMASDAYGDRVAFTSGGDSLTYAQLRDQVARAVTVLKDRSASTVVYVGPNDHLFPTIIFAAAAAGIPLVPLNYRLSSEQLQGLLADQSDDALLLVAPDEEQLVRAAGGDPTATPDMVSAIASADLADLSSSPQDPDAVAIVLYTSGTTSRPKGALLRHRHLTSYILSSVEFGAASGEDAALVSVPPYHIAGVSNVLSNVYLGRRVVQLAQFDPNAWLDAARTEAVTHALVVPTMLARVIDHLGDVEDAELPSLRTLAYGGARMPKPVLRRALELLPGTDFVNAYGLTETSSTIAVLGPDDHRMAQYVDDPVIQARLGSCGRLLPGVEVEVRAADGVVMAPGEVGEIFVRGPQVSGEYAEQGSVLDEGGWFPTRDRGWVDADDYLFIEGRADDTIIRGGENIAPAEIEDVLCADPTVSDAVVVGVPDDEWGQRIAAVVVSRAGLVADPASLQAYCREHLRSSKTPDQIEIWDELPRTDTGKLIRREVLARLVAERDDVR